MRRLIKKNGLIMKSNRLNEMYADELTIQDLRFMAVYLTNINNMNKSKIDTWFYLDDFFAYFKLEAKYGIEYLQNLCKQISKRSVNFRNKENTQFITTNFFKSVEILFDENNKKWYIQMIPNEDKNVLDLIFKIQDGYFKYSPDNYIGLSSKSQYRMYDILKQQYENANELSKKKNKTKINLEYVEFDIEIEELKKRLGIAQEGYDRIGNFKVRVLNACQEALERYTDIRYTYNKGVSGKGGKWLSIHFYIYPNEPQAIQLSLADEYYPDKSLLPATDCPNNKIEHTYCDFIVSDFAEACNNEFTETEMKELISAIAAIDPDQRKLYLENMYNALNTRCCRTDLKPIKRRFCYLKRIIKEDLKQHKKPLANYEQEHNYNLDEYKKFVNNFD